MDDVNGLIYGLELQARALAPQHGESNEVRFFIATNSLKPSNQIHLVEYNEEKAAINSKIFEHSMGEVWRINSDPHNARNLATCYSVQKGPQVVTQAALLSMPEDLETAADMKSEFLPWHQVEPLNTEPFGEKVKCIEYHPTHAGTLACVVDGKVVVYQRTEAETRVCAELAAGSKNISSSFTTGKWSLHHQGNQFITLHDCSVRSYDVRDTQHCAWSIEEAHGQYVRDLDCNPNKQCHIVTGGDDGCIKVWDARQPRDPLFVRNDHAHWVWSVRFNTFHDQLILSSSSDCKVLLTCAGSVSSEVPPAASADNSLIESAPGVEGGGGGDMRTSATDRRRVLADGLLQTFDQHEDSVYCVEWSNVDPWIFASLSYDGRLLISKVPKQFKYQIIF